MRRTTMVIIVALAGVLAISGAAWSHFLVLVPDRESVSADDKARVALEIIFTHPMADGPAMEMERPRQFGLLARGQKTDLLDTLQPVKVQGKSAYRAQAAIEQPGDHVFFVEPAPYFEPGENKMIIHYTKVVVDGMGAQEGWDAMVGLPVEIEPLVRPYGLWTGNLFRGIVRQNGQPVPFATIEVEYRNVGGKVKLPGDAFETQIIKADQDGVFAYAMPRAGWWGFAALVDGPEQMKNAEGRMVDVELGGLMWVQTTDMK